MKTVFGDKEPQPEANDSTTKADVADREHSEETKEAPQPAAQPKPESTLEAQLVSHLTLADGSVVDGDSSLVKTWSVKNTGSKPFPVGTKLIFVRGDRELSLDEEFPQSVDGTVSQETVDVSAALVAPAQEGHYTCVFQLADSERQVFGPRLSVNLKVRKSVAEPSAATNEVKEEKSDKDWVSVGDSPKTSSLPATKKFAGQLEQLQAFGFDDTALNTQLLEMHNGNIRQVVEYLFK